MNKFSDMFHRVGRWSAQPKIKKRIYAVLVLAVLIWVMFRFVMIGMERRMFVFNPARQAAENGMIVEVMSAKKTSGILRIPLTVKNNRALIAGARTNAVRPGQRVGNGTIVSVSAGIDIDTGLHTVQTRGVADGLNYAEYSATGYFVPVYAISNNTIYVVENGVATARQVRVERSDAQTALVTDGLADGDMIILSRVNDGARVQVNK